MSVGAVHGLVQTRDQAWLLPGVLIWLFHGDIPIDTPVEDHLCKIDALWATATHSSTSL